eukprot:gb/GECH01012365.1/.p1 GENE.gb/GECH01012365.1/~~gb/GECH01012365.1/.p1  ORF type:complete len:439 (+),score=90.72 gb/GECH01012365.1/:1-1317(+)
MKTLLWSVIAIMVLWSLAGVFMFTISTHQISNPFTTTPTITTTESSSPRQPPGAHSKSVSYPSTTSKTNVMQNNDQKNFSENYNNHQALPVHNKEVLTSSMDSSEWMAKVKPRLDELISLYPFDFGMNQKETEKVLQRNLTNYPITVYHSKTKYTNMKCPIPCVWSNAARARDQGDGYAVDVPGVNPRNVPPRKHSQLKRIVMTMESEEYFPILKKPSFISSFDIVATTRYDSDVPMPYFSYHLFGIFDPVQPKTASAPVAMFISNCRSKNGRMDYIRELMKYVPIHSYGRCMKNKTPEGKFATMKNKWKQKIKIAETYKFTIAFENSNVPGYVTEKLFQPLVAGSVPIYMGAPDVDRFVPSPNSYLDTKDFSSPRALADFILELDSDNTKYQKYLEWKYQMYLSEKFLKTMSLATVHSRCRICVKIRDLLVEDAKEI